MYIYRYRYIRTYNIHIYIYIYIALVAGRPADSPSCSIGRFASQDIAATPTMEDSRRYLYS